jgi:hypothetical protein
MSRSYSLNASVAEALRDADDAPALIAKRGPVLDRRVDPAMMQRHDLPGFVEDG